MNAHSEVEDDSTDLTLAQSEPDAEDELQAKGSFRSLNASQNKASSRNSVRSLDRRSDAPSEIRKASSAGVSTSSKHSSVHMSLQSGYATLHRSHAKKDHIPLPHSASLTESALRHCAPSATLPPRKNSYGRSYDEDFPSRAASTMETVQSILKELQAFIVKPTGVEAATAVRQGHRQHSHRDSQSHTRRDAHPHSQKEFGSTFREGYTHRDHSHSQGRDTAKRRSSHPVSSRAARISPPPPPAARRYSHSEENEEQGSQAQRFVYMPWKNLMQKHKEKASEEMGSGGERLYERAKNVQELKRVWANGEKDRYSKWKDSGECTFAPLISEYAQQLERNDRVHERSTREYESILEKAKRLKEESSRMEERNCTFHPSINQNSDKIAAAMLKDDSLKYTSLYDKLYREHVERKRRRDASFTRFAMKIEETSPVMHNSYTPKPAISLNTVKNSTGTASVGVQAEDFDRLSDSDKEKLDWLVYSNKHKEESINKVKSKLNPKLQAPKSSVSSESKENIEDIACARLYEKAKERQEKLFQHTALQKARDTVRINEASNALVEQMRRNRIQDLFQLLSSPVSGTVTVSHLNSLSAQLQQDSSKRSRKLSEAINYVLPILHCYCGEADYQQFQYLMLQQPKLTGPCPILHYSDRKNTTDPGAKGRKRSVSKEKEKETIDRLYTEKKIWEERIRREVEKKWENELEGCTFHPNVDKLREDLFLESRRQSKVNQEEKDLSKPYVLNHSPRSLDRQSSQRKTARPAEHASRGHESLESTHKSAVAGSAKPSDVEFVSFTDILSEDSLCEPRLKPPLVPFAKRKADENPDIDVDQAVDVGSKFSEELGSNLMKRQFEEHGGNTLINQLTASFLLR